MRSKRRFLLVAPVAVLACTLLGGLYGPRVGAAASDEALKDSYRKFTEILAVIEQNYASKVEPEKAIYQGAIPSMLHALDPHSQFFDPNSFKQLREDQKGRYAGVGMQIGLRGGNVVVIAPFPKTPAYKAGLRPMDIIAEVNGESTEGLGTGEVASRLRGEPGTEVTIGIERRGVAGLLQFTVTRAEIPRKSVPVAFHLQPSVGFIKIDTFNENTGSELDDALEELDASSLSGLILDLRNNRGGLLSEGVYVSDKFLKKGQTIVSHYGRTSAERAYKTQRGNDGLRFAMVVLVNCDSASASEIVAGALQDHDRALIAGAPTFGKGLVQTVFPLSEDGGLALTTARYYTPSGRLIQREYDEVSLIDYYNNPCSEHYRPSHSGARLTDQGRQVYSGGGITPDVVFDQQRLNDFQMLLRRNFAIETFAQVYTLENPDLAPGWEPSDEVIEQFRQFLYDEKIEFSEADLIQKENVDFIKRFLKREIYISAYDLDEAEKVYYALDPDVQKALELLPQAKRLLTGSKKLVARRQ